MAQGSPAHEVLTTYGAPPSEGAKALTAEQVAHILVKPLEAASVFLASGPRVFDTNGPLRVPIGPSVHDVSFIAEATEIPASTRVFGEYQLLPSTMKSLKTLTRYTNELARQSVVSLEMALRDRLVSDVAAKLDHQFFSASGDGITEPKGLFVDVKGQGRLNVAGTGGKLAVGDILAGQGLALEANNDGSSLRLFLNAKAYNGLTSEKAIADGRYMLQPDPTQPGVGRVFGMPVVVTNHIGDPAKPAGVIVDMSRVIVARDLAPSVTILSERYGEFDEQAIRVVCRYDWKYDPHAVVTLGDVAAAVQSP